MPLRLALLSIAVLLLAAAPAGASITVSNVQAKPADTKAGGHSNFTLSFDLGGESIKDLDVNLPPGLLGNPNNAAKCTQAQFQSDSCPAASKVGTQTVNLTVGALLPTDASGEVFNLVPDKTEPAQLGIRLDTPAGTQHLKSDVTVRPSDSGLTSTIRGIPNMLGPASLHINRISLTLLAKSGANKPFMTNPTSCGLAMTNVHATGYGGGTGDGHAGFTPTACNLLPFNPKITAFVGANGLTAKGSEPPLTTIIEQQPGEAATKAAKVTLRPPLTPNLGALQNVCLAADYAADKCEDASIVGNATAITPLLPTPLAGPVRIVEKPGALPRLVVYLNGLINVRLSGDIDLAPTGTTTTFSGIPDVPLSRFRLDFKGGDGGLVSTTEDLCKSAAKVDGELSSHSGKTVNPSVTAKPQGCPAAGGAGKRPTASVSLRRLTTKSPLLRVAAKRGAGAKRLSFISVQLPGPLSFDRGYLSPGVKAAKGLKASFPTKHTLRLRTKSTAGAASIGATVSKRALRIAAKLRKRVGKHPKVTVVVKVTEVGGRVTTLRKRVTLR